MHLVDHQELDPPTMLCPLRNTPEGRPATCMGEACALWYRSTDEDYSGCSAYVAAFYARDIAYHVSHAGNGYYRRE